MRIAKTHTSYQTGYRPCSHLGSTPRLDRLAPAIPELHPPGDTLRCKRPLVGSGISTGCPSTTTFVLGLGPTNPERTSLAQETLGIRRVGFSPTFRYSCRHSHFRPLQPSSRSTFTAERNAPLPSTNGKPSADP